MLANGDWSPEVDKNLNKIESRINNQLFRF